MAEKQNYPEDPKKAFAIISLLPPREVGNPKVIEQLVGSALTMCRRRHDFPSPFAGYLAYIGGHFGKQPQCDGLNFSAFRLTEEEIYQYLMEGKFCKVWLQNLPEEALLKLQALLQKN
jgi:hypothetical protein